MSLSHALSTTSISTRTTAANSHATSVVTILNAQRLRYTNNGQLARKMNPHPGEASALPKKTKATVWAWGSREDVGDADCSPASRSSAARLESCRPPVGRRRNEKGFLGNYNKPLEQPGAMP